MTCAEIPLFANLDTDYTYDQLFCFIKLFLELTIPNRLVSDVAFKRYMLIISADYVPDVGETRVYVDTWLKGKIKEEE